MSSVFGRRGFILSLCAAFLSTGLINAQDDHKKPDIAQCVAASKDCQMMHKQIQKVGLTEKMKEKGPFTFFCPTDKALAEMPKEDMDILLANPDLMKSLIVFTVVPRNINPKDLPLKEKCAPVCVEFCKAHECEGCPIDLTQKGKINGANILKNVDDCSNGHVYYINKVIVPECLNKEIAKKRGNGPKKTN